MKIFNLPLLIWTTYKRTKFPRTFLYKILQICWQKASYIDLTSRHPRVPTVCRHIFPATPPPPQTLTKKFLSRSAKQWKKIFLVDLSISWNFLHFWFRCDFWPPPPQHHLKLWQENFLSQKVKLKFRGGGGGGGGVWCQTPPPTTTSNFDKNII